jgi:hypothetical protein
MVAEMNWVWRFPKRKRSLCITWSRSFCDRYFLIPYAWKWTYIGGWAVGREHLYRRQENFLWVFTPSKRHPPGAPYGGVH